MSTSSMNENLNNAAKTAKDSKNDIESAAKSVGKEFSERGQQFYNNAKNYVDDVTDGVKQKSVQSAEMARSKIQAQPIAYVLGAAALGVLVGALWRRGGSRMVSAH